MFKHNWVFYTHNYNVNSGGSSVFFKLCLELREKYNNNFYIAPIVCRGDGISAINEVNPVDRHNRSLSYIDNLHSSYFDKNNYNWPEEYKQLLITKELLSDRNNVAVYSEGILGNPLEQKYIIRWILYFPTPGLPVCPTFPWGKNDKFLFWDMAYYINIDAEYYGLNDLCVNKSDYYPNEKDLLFGSYVFLHKNIDLNTTLYKKSNNRKGSCYLIRKADPNYNRTLKQNWNFGNNYNPNHPYLKPKPPVLIHPADSVIIDNYDLNKLINVFKEKEFFYCYDLYTFHNCLAMLYGCKVIMCPPDCNLTKEEWHCGNKSYLDYVAWGDSPEELSKMNRLYNTINYGDILKEHINYNTQLLFTNLLNIDNNINDTMNKIDILDTIIFNGSYYKNIEFSSDTYYPEYTNKYSVNQFNIEFVFKIYPNNVDYANLLSFNYSNTRNVNMGPRIEYNNGILGIIIGNNWGDWSGYIISKNILIDHNYKLKIDYLSNNLNIILYSLDDNTEVSKFKYHIIYKPTYFKELVFGKGFNEERYFKGEISNFKFLFL